MFRRVPGSKRWLLAVLAAAAATGTSVAPPGRAGPAEATGLGQLTGLLPASHLTLESAIQVNLSNETVRLPLYPGDLAGVFQLNSVSSRNGLTRVINDWEVGVPGFFGKNKRTTLTAFLVRGTAPGKVTGHERPISNVIHETFTIGG